MAAAAEGEEGAPAEESEEAEEERDRGEEAIFEEDALPVLSAPLEPDPYPSLDAEAERQEDPADPSEEGAEFGTEDVPESLPEEENGQNGAPSEEEGKLPDEENGNPAGNGEADPGEPESLPDLSAEDPVLTPDGEPAPEEETIEPSRTDAPEEEAEEESAALIPVSEEMNEPAESDDPEEPDESEEAEEPEETGDSYVKSLVINSMLDGTAPFDGDSEPGNDADASNGIVRSFDEIAYTLEYTTALTDEEKVVDEANLLVSITLECDPEVAEFDEDSLHWCQGAHLSYTYLDGSEKEEWDPDREVVSQTYTGYRHLSGRGEENAVPGSGTLSVSIRVKAAPNGTVLTPIFTVWMEGSLEEVGVTSTPVTVSAAPRYNVALVRNSAIDTIGTFDPETGTGGSESSSSVHGRLEGYGITLQLYNDSADKGLKGIELSSGDITFDLVLPEEQDG